MYLKIVRQKPKGKAVRGTLYEVHFIPNEKGGYNERLCKICDTLENLDYLISPLIYPIKVTQSPKFKRLLPLICNVPNRAGLRIHAGSKPEHSKGCVLVSRDMVDKITNMLLEEQKDGKEVRIEIT